MKSFQAVQVAFQGEPGAYSEAAALEFYPSAIPVPCASFELVFSAVASALTPLGMIPIENSLAGSIHRNYDLMLRHQLSIVGEYHLRIRHCLLALPGTRLDEIRSVHSHPQALAQCEGNLNRLGLNAVPESDTAGSARLLLESQDRSQAVIASRRAAAAYGLNILAENMEDNLTNFTRFLALSTQPFVKAKDDSQEYKTSVVFSLDNRPGVLFKALSVFALREIDLTKIESRPIPGSLWEYVFYIDFCGHAADLPCSRALDHLSELTTFQRVLGSYPRHRLEPEAGNGKLLP